MKAMSPVIPEFQDEEVVYGEGSNLYLPLPALPIDNGRSIVTRWRLTWRERLRVLFRGDLYLSVQTFGRSLQPVMLETSAPQLKKT